MNNVASVARAPYLIAVCGLKNCGKTTFVVGLIRELTSAGFKVAAIKHVAHDFAWDAQGTDSYRFGEAGASSVAVYSAHRYMFMKDEAGDPEMFTGLAGDCDIVILEGGKDLDWPKIAIVRDGISNGPVTRDNLRLVATNTDYVDIDVPTIGLNDHSAAAAAVIGLLEEYHTNNSDHK